MAHLALTIDDDPARRAAFTARVQSLFAGLPGTVSTATVGRCTCVWTVGPRAPVSVHRITDTFAILLGYAIDDDGRWITAADLPPRWLSSNGAHDVFDGYHVGVAYDEVRGLAAAVDPLGLFPLHHGMNADAVIVATTPEAFRCHPGFAERIDREALAGILLVNGPLDDRPILAGIRRLARGHRVRWQRTGTLAAEVVHRMEGAAAPAGESSADALRRIDDELVRAIRRHRPPAGSTAIMLSGGLDSRLVAGCLTDLGVPARGVILGSPDDYEVVAGKAVAERLGLPHTVASTESRDGDFPTRIRDIVRFSHLNAAPGGDDFAVGLELAGTHEPYFWSGLVLDWAFEPVAHANGRDPQTGGWSFDPLLETMNGWGVSARDLPALLGGDGVDLVAAVVARLREACVAGPSDAITQSSLLRWDQRVRNHVTQAIHPTTFVSWPLVPATDRRLFSAILGLPVHVYEDRRLEEAVLLARRPDLATIPLDTNSFRFDPLVASTGLGRGMRQAASSLRKRLRSSYWRLRGFDPRRYERLYNVDEPRWRLVRDAAEPWRPRLHSILDNAAVDRILPGPREPTGFPKPVTGGCPLRLLLGLALWHARPAV